VVVGIYPMRIARFVIDQSTHGSSYVNGNGNGTGNGQHPDPAPLPMPADEQTHRPAPIYRDPAPPAAVRMEDRSPE
jgi:hypothetical protein